MTNKELEKDFNEFKVEQRENTKNILAVLEKLAGGDVKQTTPKDVVEKEDPTVEPQKLPPLSEEHEAIYIKYFDPKDGFIFATDYPERNRVTLYVPKEISNASEAHWSMHGIDMRSSGALLDDFDAQMEQWLERVQKQLHYNRHMVRK